MNKKLTPLAGLVALGSVLGEGSRYAYPYQIHYPARNSQKNYTNKNRNIEYYYDEKGNIRKRKIKEEN